MADKQMDDVTKGVQGMKMNNNNKKRWVKTPPKKKADLPPTTPRPLRSSAASAAIRLEGEPRISLRANHFEVEIQKSFPPIIYHYDVVIRNEEVICKDPVLAATNKKRQQDQAARKKAEGDEKETSGLPDRMLPAIWKEFQRQNATILKYPTPFDGVKNVYTARRLEFEHGDAYNTVMNMDDPDDPDKKRKFKVEVKLVKQVDTNSVAEFMRSGMTFGEAVVQPQEVIQGLDVALRHAPANARNFIACGQSFFNSQPIKRHSLDKVLELLSGHYQSYCLGSQNTATLNIDLATKAFYKQMLLVDYLRRSCDLPFHAPLDVNAWNRGDGKLLARATEALQGKLIIYGTGPQTKRVVDGKEIWEYQNYHKFTANRLINTAASVYKFTITTETGEQKAVTIEQYMLRKNTRLVHPEYPCVHIGNKNLTNYVPLELCTIITQPYKGKMEPELTSAMIKGAAIAPADRFRRIEEARKGCRFETCKVLADFGIKVGERPIDLVGYRILPPVINNKTSKGKVERADVNRTEGKWTYTINTREKQDQRHYIQPAAVPKWMILDCVGGGVAEETLTSFRNTLTRMGAEHGMRNFAKNFNTVKRLSEFAGLDPRRSDTGNFGESNESRCKRLETAMTKAQGFGYKLIIVIMNNDGKEYQSIKTVAEVKVGILTACIKAKNVTQGKQQTLVNFLLKLNSKLNGTNFEVHPLTQKFLNEPTMILGADVTHPSPNSSAPSIAAVTASFNGSAMGYTMHIQPQKGEDGKIKQGKELITNMDEIVQKNLTEFREKTGRLPKVLLLFRDGVSEGYFDEIKSYEYERMKKVCDFMTGDGPKIKITFVIVKKRHHTRFQPKIKLEGVGKFFNIPPGTVVESKIVHPAEQEFFLNSHVGIQGTSKPTRYHVIHDDNNYNMGDLMRITYYLCYGFVRCTQPVSYPAATYYAHLAAYRARNLLEKEGENANIGELEKQLTIHPQLKKEYPMFFV